MRIMMIMYMLFSRQSSIEKWTCTKETKMELVYLQAAYILFDVSIPSILAVVTVGESDSFYG